MQLQFVQHPNGDAVARLIPNFQRDKDQLEREFDVKNDGDVITLVRINGAPTKQDPNPFHLESVPINIGVLNTQEVEEPETKETNDEKQEKD